VTGKKAMRTHKNDSRNKNMCSHGTNGCLDGRPAGKCNELGFQSGRYMPRFSTYIEDGMPVAVEGSAPSYHVHVGARVNRDPERATRGQEKRATRTTICAAPADCGTVLARELVRMFSLDKS
jgi:hypothetical protein